MLSDHRNVAMFGIALLLAIVLVFVVLSIFG